MKNFFIFLRDHPSVWALALLAFFFFYNVPPGEWLKTFFQSLLALMCGGEDITGRCKG